MQKVQERWFEKLHEWDKALEAYEAKQEQQPDEPAYLLGRLRCLEALGQWDELHRLAGDRWGLVPDNVRQQMARMASAAAWGMGECIASLLKACRNNVYKASQLSQCST